MVAGGFQQRGEAGPGASPAAPPPRLCRPALGDDGSSRDDPLSPREREIISLVFDAGLTREQIPRIFRVPEAMVSSGRLNGLRNLKEQTSPAVAAAYLRLA